MNTSLVTMTADLDSATPYLVEIERLAGSVARHPALNNPFFDLWVNEDLSAGALEEFARNYFHWVEPTVSRLTLALAHVDDLAAKADLVENISDELGHGDPARMHVPLLKRWLDALLLATCGHPFDDVLDLDALTPATRRLRQRSLELCAGTPAAASGAILAQEWHAYTQLVLLTEGMQRYRNHFDVNEFHDANEYLYIHIGRAEKEHKVQGVRLAARSCRTASDFQELRTAFTEFLNLLAAFWFGLYEVSVARS